MATLTENIENQSISTPVKKGELLIKVENVSKKLCKDLKKSLWYGMQDITKAAFGLSRKTGLRNKEFWAIDDVSFELRRGECIGLMGTNGAGKSTMLKMLNGLLKPDKGQITLQGRIGALIELGAGFNPILTGRENVYVNGAILGFTKKEITAKFNDILAFSEIDDFIDSPVQNYSSGMKMRLGFAIACHMEPDILLIDEVLAVGDVGFRTKCINKLKEMIPHCCVVFVSHIPHYTVEICSDILLLNKGKMAFYGKDVVKGVEMYEWFNLNEKEKERKKQEEKESIQKKTLAEKERKENLGQIEIIDCHFFETSNPKNKNNFEQFSLLQLNIEVSFKQKYAGYASGFSVTNQHGITVLSSRSDLIQSKTLNNLKFTIQFKNILLPGEYFLNLHFLVKTQSQIETSGRTGIDFVNFYKFKSKGKRRFVQSPIQLSGTWKVIEK